MLTRGGRRKASPEDNTVMSPGLPSRFTLETKLSTEMIYSFWFRVQAVYRSFFPPTVLRVKGYGHKH